METRTAHFARPAGTRIDRSFVYIWMEILDIISVHPVLGDDEKLTGTKGT